MKTILLKFLVFCPILMLSQSQLGLDIDGEAASDQSGWSVSLNLDGTILAIGAPKNLGNGSRPGHVRVYQFSLGSWTQLGADIDGEAGSDNLGYSVSLSADGTILAIGALLNDGNGSDSGHVRVYQFSLGSWTQLGSDIDGEAGLDNSGKSVSLSSNGTIVAIGAHFNDGNGFNSGHVRVYQFSVGSWTQLGADIDGEAANDQFGSSVNLNSDGTILAVGAPQNNGNGGGSGHVRVYQFSLGSWTQLGADIDGEAASDLLESVSLNSDGTILAIGASRNDGNGSDSGHVRVYQFSLGSWTQLGADIDGEAVNDFSGESVSLNSDGTIVAIGASQNDGNGSDSGHVRVYQFSLGSWTQLGVDIDGEAVNDSSGFSVSLNNNGLILAIGAFFNDGNGSDSGHVRVYDLSATLSSNSLVLSQLNIYPNPAKEQFTIQLSQGLELKKVNIYNSLGQFISSTRKNIVNTINLSQGFYFIEIETVKGKATKKIIIE